MHPGQGASLLDGGEQRIDRPDGTCHGKARSNEKCQGACHLDAALVLQMQRVKATVFQTQTEDCPLKRCSETRAAGIPDRHLRTPIILKLPLI